METVSDCSGFVTGYRVTKCEVFPEDTLGKNGER